MYITDGTRTEVTTKPLDAESTNGITSPVLFTTTQSNSEKQEIRILFSKETNMKNKCFVKPLYFKGYISSNIHKIQAFSSSYML